ncbi:MAG: glycine zipper 2TM domain-containing protein [Verrucomicrobiae bacterium]|nr:glycine zipper 2TM domain-containing protein [Verrucomicrobiae bacterium]
MNFLVLRRVFPAAILSAALLHGCTTTEESTGIGTGVGAAAGAGIGYAVGGSDGWWIGALAGSAVGAASGYLIGSEIEDQETEEERAVAQRSREVDAAPLREDNSRREQSPRYYAYEVGPEKYMVYDNSTGKYWQGVYKIPDAKKGDVAKIAGKWVEVR